MKPALYYALVGGYSPSYLGYLKIMAVTSEKRNQYGKLKLVYGRDDYGTATNRAADAIHFTYRTEEAAKKALEAATIADAKFKEREKEITEMLRENNRARSVEVNRVLGLNCFPRDD